MPTYVVALLPSIGKETGDELAALHLSILSLADQCGLSILSIAADGAAPEVSAQTSLHKSAKKFLTFKDPASDINIQIPLFGQIPKPVIPIQDVKHARKTGANQILSGARLLSFGQFYLSIGHLALLLQAPNSTLYQKDTFNTDRQDDGRAYRTFNNETFKLALSLEPCTGLAVFLYVIGELIDSWLNQSSTPAERLLSAFTSHFFLRRWQEYLKERQQDTPGLMSAERNGMSHQAVKTFLKLALSLLSLIIAHREYYPGHPFMPWKHGTEACEHIFGWMRKLLEDFCVLDARQMMPKIHTIVKNVMEKKIKMPSSECIHSGYQHSFDNFSGDNSRLYDYPTDAEIYKILHIAQKRAESLITFTGMQKLNEPFDFAPSATDVNDDIFGFNHQETEDQSASSHPQSDTSAAIQTAATQVGRRHELDQQLEELELTDEAIDKDYISANKMSLSNLLNPEGKSSKIFT